MCACERISFQNCCLSSFASSSEQFSVFLSVNIQALNILAAKKSAIIQQTNDENALPEHYAASAAAAKQEAKIPVDQFKAFAVFEEEQSPADENVPPKKKESSVSDEVDSTTMTNSYTTVRYLSTMTVNIHSVIRSPFFCNLPFPCSNWSEMLVFMQWDFLHIFDCFA